jgi:hypothetical protein
VSTLPARVARGNVVMYHTAPASRLQSILHSGILPALSRGARMEACRTVPGLAKGLRNLQGLSGRGGF